MRKFNLVAIFAFLSVYFCSCADDKQINGVTYRPYSFMNEETCKKDSIQYELSIEACVSGVFFFGTGIVPIYVFGFNLFEPVGLKSEYKNNNLKGVIND